MIIRLIKTKNKKTATNLGTKRGSTFEERGFGKREKKRKIWNEKLREILGVI